MWEDPIVNEVRKAGKNIIKKHGNDLHKVCEYLRKDEKINPAKYVSKKTKILLKKTSTIN